MLKRNVALYIGFGLALGSISDLSAQHGGLLFDAPASTSAMAWGNAPYLWNDSPDLMFYAPGRIGGLSGFAGSLQRFGSEGTLASLAAAGSVGLGEFAVGVQNFTYEIDAFASSQDLQSQALSSGDFGVTETAVSLGYARELFGLDAGVVARYVEQRIDAVDDGLFAFDIGLAKDLGPAIISLSARNLGSDVEVDALPCNDPPCAPSPQSLEVPTNVALGVSTEQFEVGEFDMFLTGQLMRRDDGEMVPGGGLELSYWPVQGYTFRLRGGLQRVVEDGRSPLTFGAAFSGDALTIEYAFQSFDQDGNAHRLGILIR